MTNNQAPESGSRVEHQLTQDTLVDNGASKPDSILGTEQSQQPTGLPVNAILSELTTENESPKTSTLDAAPKIVYGRGVDPSLVVDSQVAAETMRQLGVSETGIAKSAVYIDPKNRLANNGTHYSRRQGRLRFRRVPELKGVEGDIVRLSTRVRGKERTAEQMNRTAVHEWEHLAQTDRHDRKVTKGHAAESGLAAAGALAGKRLGGRGIKGKIGAAAGGFIGYQVGYRLAPHERQARKRAGQGRGWTAQVTSSAVTRKEK